VTNTSNDFAYDPVLSPVGHQGRSKGGGAGGPGPPQNFSGPPQNKSETLIKNKIHLQ
jgi:hypothetical protein